MDYDYQILTPGGNDTALVFAAEKNLKRRRLICQTIMLRNPAVEQVGFFSWEGKIPRLLMAGGEFCGNAARAVAWYVLGGKPGTISLKVSGNVGLIKGGVTESGEAWVEMPVVDDIEHIKRIEPDCFLVDMRGIVHIVVLLPQNARFDMSDEMLKRETQRLLAAHHLLGSPATGVVFTKNLHGRLQIYPCVRVAAVGTLICETACGSGTMAVGLVDSLLKNADTDITIFQPSGQTIRAVVKRDGKKIAFARILGKVTGNGKIFTVKTS